MTNEENQVRKFYEQIWNNADLEVIPDVLHENLKFRGSLGMHQDGHAGFINYLDMVHESLGEYTCQIDDLVCQPGKAFARVTFTGVHKGTFMDYPPTGKRLSWAGAALFTFNDGKVKELWVLGDLLSLERQLKQG